MNHPTQPPFVVIESPLKGDFALNTAYARAAMFDSLVRGEAPYLSHLLYPQVLDDADPDDRQKGLTAALVAIRKADLVAAYIDFGISGGMQAALAFAESLGKPIVQRSIDFNTLKIRPTSNWIPNDQKAGA